MKVKILCDSTCDATKEILDKFDISTIPLCVNLGDDERLDSVNVTNQDIVEFVKKTGKLPKTAARSVEDYKTLYKSYYDQGYDIVMFSISEELSVSYHNAVTAAEALDPSRIFVVNGRVLSTGTLLLAMHAVELARKGKSAKEIFDIESKRAYNAQVSFVVETLEYLYKGGRCSMMAAFGANLLRLKPKLQLIDGKIVSTEKYRGKSLAVFKKYIDDTLSLYNNPDRTRCFITHADTDKEILQEIIAYTKSKGIFEEVLVSKANSTIFSHCGKGTLGILYLNDGGME